jgi:hypothetical protein
LKAIVVETLPRINHLAGRINQNKKRNAVAGKFAVNLYLSFTRQVPKPEITSQCVYSCFALITNGV